MKKIIVLFQLLLILFIVFSSVASGIKIWPGKNYITINKWYEDGEKVDHPRIEVTNPESYDINVSVSIDTPHVNTLSGGYSQIPDLSWVKVVPEVLYLPGRSSDFVEVYIDVPESEQSLHFNEKWEALVVFTEPSKSGGGVNIQIELASRLFIRTPKGEEARLPYMFILIGIIIIALIIFILQSYFKNKRSKQATYYFKKNK